MTNTRPSTFPAPAAAALSHLFRSVTGRFRRQADDQAAPLKTRSDLCLAQASRRTAYYAELKLPQGLLQAFSAEPLGAGDSRLVERKEQADRLLAALERWRAGHSTMVAVTGPQGCGITTFLQQLSGQIADTETCRYGELTRRPYDVHDSLALLSEIVGCEQPSETVEQLVAYINGLTPQVLAVDNGHFLACRIMGANEAIRVFGAVMVATQHRHLWVLGCEEYAWRRLVYMYRADRYFSDRIELSLFSEAELGQGMAARLLAAGITAESGEDTGLALIPDALARYLPTLHKLSNGKPDLACFCFLGSLLRQDGNDELDIQSILALDFSLLKQLISEELFTLAEVAAHGQLTINDHCAVFRSSREESWLLLERLYHQCLLDRNETGTGLAYRLVPLYSDVITRHLANVNYLY